MKIDIFNGAFKGKRVLVTGHTGFKGSWLSIWLHELGAEVIGVGLEPYSEKDNFVLSGIGQKIKADIRADIRDGQKMKDIFAEYQPEIVFQIVRNAGDAVDCLVDLQKSPRVAVERQLPVVAALICKQKRRHVVALHRAVREGIDALPQVGKELLPVTPVPP